ncbi:asparagine synthase-related protein [Dyella sp. 2HG41-7]|uniref:asparagine synthase-related protein n=1 Tax=Dyella sp. 2HG41-7 TaxID=2883239 RepID=UPI001F37BBC4|nr:asparagine synthase-related protein [Dyella sp. 2HG41-7]
MTSAILPNKIRHTFARSRIQVNTSPYQELDFSPLEEMADVEAPLDLVSIADLLRNSFVYPPHSVYRNVKVAASGFNPTQDMYENPQFQYPFQSALAASRPTVASVDGDALLETYHRLLCDAVRNTTAKIKSPWLLQSGGKDSTSMAIAVADVRPDTNCLTYLGGREENEVASARHVARQLGLRHEALVCHPGRAYDRYLAMVPRMPLLTADFALLSYADLATEIRLHHGDGVIDALGADQYFGTPLHSRERILALFARGLRLPQSIFKSRVVSRSFKLCYALATLQMSEFERYFPGSRFSDSEVDELFGWQVSTCSRQRIETFRNEIATADSSEAVRRIAFIINEAANMAKGMYATKAMSLRLVFPYCNEQLRDWIFNHVPNELLIGSGGVNKVLMRQHIAKYFDDLPYVKAKGSFRFDLRGLAQQRYEQVHDFARQAQSLLPGALPWLESHRNHLYNKYFASKFYLLAITLPWLLNRMHGSAKSSVLTHVERIT